MTGSVKTGLLKLTDNATASATGELVFGHNSGVPTLHYNNTTSGTLATLGAQTFTGLQTFNAGATISTGQFLTVTDATASRALVSDASSRVVASTVTTTRLQYLASAGGTTGTTSTNLVFSTSPTLVTPTLGVASATSINKVAITAPATGSTLTIADGKTLTASNTLTFTGTDSSSVAFGAGGTVAYLGTAQQWTEAQTFNTSILVLGGTATTEDGIVIQPQTAGSTTKRITITNAAPAANRTYTLPDAGAAANFVMSEGTATINGAKTFGNLATFNAGVSLTVAGSAVTLGDGTTATGAPLYISVNQVGNGGKLWRVGHTGAVAGFNTIDIYNQTDSATYASFGNDAITLSKPVTATSINASSGDTASLGSGAAADIATTVSTGVYLVHVMGNSNSTQYAQGYAYSNNSGGVTVTTIAGAALTLGSSGTNKITVTNSSTTQTIKYTVLRIL
jgi:hypothetical protein